MKKVLTILCALLLLTLTACNGKSEEAPVETVQEKEELPMNISQEDWNDSRKFVELSTGIKMAYVEMGNPDGQIVLLQHGMTDNSRSWSFVAPIFCEAGYHVYMPDLRGMGLSDAPDGYYTPVTYATDLEAFFDAVDIDSAIVVGHSLGSYTVQTFSIMFPERVDKLVLVSSLPLKQYQNDKLMIMNEKFIKPLAEDEHPSDAFMDMWYATDLKEEEYADTFDTFISYMKKEAQALSKKAWTNILFGLTIDTFTLCYSQVDKSIPVLILHGDFDDMAVGEHQQELCDIFGVKEDSYRNYEGIGHNIHFEIPRQCATDILAWLETGSLPE